MSAFFCVVLSRVGRGLAMGRSPIKAVLPKSIKGFKVSKVFFSESNHARGPNL
jgi:hypothetical protein